jgi:uncharacterized protein (TIGR03067 family)
MRLFIPLIAGLVTPSLPAADPIGEQQKFQGTWIARAVEVNGEQIAEESFKHGRMIVNGGRVTLLFKGEVRARGNVTFDANKTPSEITLEFTEGTDKGKRSLGIYKVEDGRLTICWTLVGVSRERPSRFETAPKSGLTLVVQERLKE